VRRRGQGTPDTGAEGADPADIFSDRGDGTGDPSPGRAVEPVGAGRVMCRDGIKRGSVAAGGAGEWWSAVGGIDTSSTARKLDNSIDHVGS